MPVIPLHASRPLERREDNTSTDNANPSSNEQPTGPNPGLIAGAVTGILLVLFVVLVILIPYLKRRRRMQEHGGSVSAPMNPAMRQFARVSRPDRSFFGHRKVPKHLVLQSPRRVSFAIPNVPQRQNQHQAPLASAQKSAMHGTPRSMNPITPRSALLPPVTPRSALLSLKSGGAPIPRSPLVTHSPINSAYTPNYPPYSAAIQPGKDANPFLSPFDEKAEPSALSTSGEASPLTAYINHLNTASKVPPKTAPAFTTSHNVGKGAQQLQRRGTVTSAPGSGKSLGSESDYSTSPEIDRLGPHGYGNAPHSMPARGHESFATDQDKRLGGAGQRLQDKFLSPKVVTFQDRSSLDSPESDYGSPSPVIPFPEPQIPSAVPSSSGVYPHSPLSAGDEIILSPNPLPSAFPFKSPGAYTPMARDHF